jgi:hypothetical protein
MDSVVSYMMAAAQSDKSDKVFLGVTGRIEVSE